jgi:hypothetical protein
MSCLRQRASGRQDLREFDGDQNQRRCDHAKRTLLQRQSQVHRGRNKSQLDKPMTERMMEYRLSWEMPIDHWKISEIETIHGRDVWPKYDWDTLEWHQQEVVWRDGNEGDHFDQHATLKQWAETREQPIRNVKLEWRPIDVGNWEPVG